MRAADCLDLRFGKKHEEPNKNIRVEHAWSASAAGKPHHPVRGSRTTFVLSLPLTIALSLASHALSVCALRSSMSLCT